MKRNFFTFFSALVHKQKQLTIPFVLRETHNSASDNIKLTYLIMATAWRLWWTMFTTLFLLSSLDEWTTLRHNQTHFHKKLFLFQMIFSFVGIGNHPIEALMKCESTTTTANCSKCFNCIPFLIRRRRTCHRRWLGSAVLWFSLDYVLWRREVSHFSVGECILARQWIAIIQFRFNTNWTNERAVNCWLRRRRKTLRSETKCSVRKLVIEFECTIYRNYSVSTPTHLMLHFSWAAVATVAS